MAGGLYGVYGLLCCVALLVGMANGQTATADNGTIGTIKLAADREPVQSGDSLGIVFTPGMAMDSSHISSSRRVWVKAGLSQPLVDTHLRIAASPRMSESVVGAASVLRISNLTLDDSGVYYCRIYVMSVTDNMYHSPNVTVLVVSVPPEPTAEPTTSFRTTNPGSTSGTEVTSSTMSATTTMKSSAGSEHRFPFIALFLCSFHFLTMGSHYS